MNLKFDELINYNKIKNTYKLGWV